MKSRSFILISLACLSLCAGLGLAGQHSGIGGNPKPDTSASPVVMSGLVPGGVTIVIPFKKSSK